MKTVLKRPVELVVGDVIRAHGARWLVVNPPHQTSHEGGKTFATKTKYLGVIEPGSYRGYRSMVHDGYMIQGNDLAKWAVEVPDTRCWDCGSTIEGHHTQLCEMAGSDDARDLPSQPGTQWWTGEVNA